MNGTINYNNLEILTLFPFAIGKGESKSFKKELNCSSDKDLFKEILKTSIYPARDGEPMKK